MNFSLFLLFPDEIRKEIKKLLCARYEKTEVNLRKYKILGGVFHIDLIYHPPQAKYIEDITVTTCE